MSGSVSDFLSHSNKISTHNNYDIQWRKWAEWCVRQVPRIDPTTYNPGIVVEYLVQNKQFSYQHLNGIRSAIASVFRVLHSDKPSLALIKISLKEYFFCLCLVSFKPLHNKHLMKRFNSFSRQKGESTQLYEGGALKRLQEKTVLLLAMVTMWRQRSDLGRLQYEDVQFEMDNEQKIVGVMLLARNPKEITPKQSKFEGIDEEIVCPVKIFWYFVECTKGRRAHLSSNHTLFLTYIEDDDFSKSSSIKDKTVVQ
ncbi:hypothetical protein BCV72DRAFT_311108 [Rhizopus microsporus var. microsporus]|uniref:Uncharacterized protein n=1 Tax=Rhizopus microsporus var. microsporus TaxID=86635 RepID=A0A1X0RJE5_RHIZD|nr:hypothetical protein BCV72DRAFT_311108 [Rhizopus microsporus var. microsporus]